MRLLLDTHIVLAFLNRSFDRVFPQFHRYFARHEVTASASIASIWEIAIKSNLGKLDVGMPLVDIPRVLDASGIAILAIDLQHVITPAESEPPTRDPFDRLLLAQCQVEALHLVTIDRALADHRLAFRF